MVVDAEEGTWHAESWLEESQTSMADTRAIRARRERDAHAGADVGDGRAGPGRGHRRGAEQHRRAGLQRAEPDPAPGQARGDVPGPQGFLGRAVLRKREVHW